MVMRRLRRPALLVEELVPQQRNQLLRLVEQIVLVEELLAEELLAEELAPLLISDSKLNQLARYSESMRQTATL